MDCLKQFSPPLFKKLLLGIALVIIVTLSAHAQERCGTVQYTNTLLSKNLRLEKNKQFEEWLRNKISTRKQSLDAGRTQTTTYQIPVVIHVVHNGEALGVGVNISNAQILSQIAVLNNDFRRQNADAVNTPAEFLPAAGAMDIEFVLAKQTPVGAPTTGIVRVKGSKNLWTMGDDAQLKAQSYWPAEDYFNIWICNMYLYLGYTQFPISSLPGLAGAPNNRLTDGVVISYQFFGTKDAGNFNLTPRYDKGRTVTHEVGHFFGLRHIWGDDGGLCPGETNSEDDYVSDTPEQGDNTNGCPSSTRTSCLVHNMYQNYMDYTDDACMNVFTKEQVTRMVTVLENSVRRKTLYTSPGLIDPASVANNLGIKTILSPYIDECTHTLSPSIEIKNYGNNTITAAEIQLTIDGAVVETVTPSLALTVGNTTVLNFTPIIRNVGNHALVFKILTVNTVTDGEPSNDQLSITTLVSDRIATPFEENFFAIPFNWKVQNPDQLITWQIQTAPFYTPSNTSVVLNFFDYKNTSATDMLVSPPFDLTTETLAFFSFDVAYAENQTRGDGLKVYLLTNCNTDISLGTQVYFKSGAGLATTTPTSIAFKPKDQDDWRREVIDLSQYLGQNNLRLAFVGINGHGNNLYIDNASMITSLDIDAAITNIMNPSTVSCSETIPRLLVQNIGTTPLTSFNIKYQVNASEVKVMPITGVSIKSGDDYEVTLPAIDLKNGTNVVTFEVFNPNSSGPDSDASNNKKSTTVVTNNAALTIPFRENFNNGFGTQWLSLNATNGMRWSLEKTNYSTSAAFNAFSDSELGEEAWLVSPSLDFSHANEASIYFDRSYAPREVGSDGEQVRILASVGCGNSFDITLYDSSNLTLPNVPPSNNWKPTKAVEWKRDLVNLSSLRGKKDVRLAFVITNGQGNNFYLDNLEFFTSATPDTVTLKDIFTVYSSPTDNGTFHIKFNLPQQQSVGLEIIDVMGRVISNTRLDYILNDSLDVLLDNLTISTGVYIVRLHTAVGYSAKRVLIQK